MGIPISVLLPSFHSLIIRLFCSASKMSFCLLVYSHNEWNLCPALQDVPVGEGGLWSQSGCWGPEKQRWATQTRICIHNTWRGTGPHRVRALCNLCKMLGNCVGDGRPFQHTYSRCEPAIRTRYSGSFDVTTEG